MQKRWKKEKTPIRTPQNNCCGQNSQMNAEINKQNFKEKQSIRIVSKYLSQET